MRIYTSAFFLFFASVFLCAILLFPYSYPNRNEEESKLNCLLITIDTLRADRLSCYDSEYLETPNIDGLAKNGVIFTRAFANTSTTLPSHANILLGTVPLYHGVHENGTFRVKEEFLTLAEHLKAYGYSTGAFIGAYPLDSRFGLAQGFDVYDDDYRGQINQKNSLLERNAEEVVSKALEWLKAQAAPWFLWVHCFDPHYPYEPPEPFRSQYEENPYDGEVAYVDFALKSLFSHIKDNNLSGSTLIIFTGDHGESLGEHGEMTHGYFAYNSSIWVPFVISAPALSKGQNTQYVSHIDIFPTICDILHLKKPPFLQGASLLPALKGKKLAEMPIYFEAMTPYYSRGWAPLKGYIYEDEKFIESPIPEVYDLNNDFDELQNLVERKKLEKYRKQLSRMIENQSHPDGNQEQKKKIDRESLEKLRSLGYISSPQTSLKKSFGPNDDIKTFLPYHNRAMKAMELYIKGEVKEGIEILEEINSEKNDVDIAYYFLATMYKEQERLNDAIALLRLGLEHLPSNYEIFSTYVNFLLNAGQHDEVIEIVNAMNLRQMEFDPEIWNYLGSAYSRKGDSRKAIEAYERALSIDSKYQSALNNLGTIYLSIYLKTKDSRAYQRSVQYFKMAIEVDNESVEAYNGLGAAYKVVGNLEAAIFCWEKALEIKPGFAKALYNLGLAYLEKGDKVKALNRFNKYKEGRFQFLSPSEKKKLEELIQKCKQE